MHTVYGALAFAEILELLRAVHNGSVNDYASYAVGGAIAVVTVFLL
ncbi:hypothetical protein ABH926_004459 [Catenulispora sp. GP43]